MNNLPQKVLVGSIQKFSIDDGPGIRTTIFIKGCPLKCRWCHNPEMIDPNQQLINSSNKCIGCGSCVAVCPNRAVSANENGNIVIDRLKCGMCLKCVEVCYSHALRPVAKAMTIDEIMNIAEQDKDFYESTGGGITVSGGEILMHASFVEQLIDEASRRHINACVDTSGFGDSKTLINMCLKENVSDILYDIKSIDDDIHQRFTGVSNQPIIENLRMLAADERIAHKLTLRMPIVNGINDGDELMMRTGALYNKLDIKRVNLLPYHSLGVNKEKNIGGFQEVFQQPTQKRMEVIREILLNQFRGNVDILEIY